MSYRVEPSDVRNRLKNISSLDIDDTKLNSLAFIESAESYVNVLLANNGVSYASLTSDKQTLVKYSEVLLTCEKIVTDAPEEVFKTGVIDSKPPSSNDKKIIADKLHDEALEVLA